MAVVRWTFHDPVAVQTYTFEINPREGGTPQYEKQLQYQNTTAPDGKTLIFEGLDEPKKITFSGAIVWETQMDAFVEWFNKRRVITVEDDLGREFQIYITSFKPERRNSTTHPWRHNYTIEATLLDGW